jgi:hypothetical protein
MSNSMLTTAEVARRLRTTVRGIHDGRYRGADLPPAILVAGRLLFPSDELQAWVDRRLDEAKSEADLRNSAIQGRAAPQGGVPGAARKNPRKRGSL